MKAVLAAAAALTLATSASAGLVRYGDYTHVDTTGNGVAFTDTYTLNLGAATWITGLLTTSSKVGGLPAIDIQSVSFKQLGNAVDWAPGVAVDWDLFDGGVETWALSTRQLAAGSWQLQVSGVSYYTMSGHGYTADVQLPEPGSVGLAAVALLGAAATRLRRRQG